MRLLIIASLLFSSTTALAAGDGIPVGFVIKQVVHFSAFAVILGWLVVKKVVPMIAAKKEEFLTLMKKAEASKAEAEKLRSEFRQKLDELENTKTQTIDQARTEAEAIKNKILKEAQEASAKMISDAMNTVQYEVDKAKTELRQSLLEESISAAEEALKKKNANEMANLDKHFVEKIQVVQ